MSIKHRLKVFVSNWLGVIVAAVIMLVTGTLGFTYLQLSSRLDNTLAFATQFITLKVPNGIYKTGTTISSSPYVFHVVIQVGNETAIPAEVTISNMKIIMNSIPTPITQSGPWTKTVTEASGDGTGLEDFEGDFTIDAQTFAGLVSQGSVNIDIQGNVYASARSGFLSKHASRVFDISLPNIPFNI